MITPRQREVIDSYRRRLQWTPEGFDTWLKKTLGLTTATLARRQDASKAIAVLQKLIAHAERKAALKAQGMAGDAGAMQCG